MQQFFRLFRLLDWWILLYRPVFCGGELFRERGRADGWQALRLGINRLCCRR